MNTQTTKLPQAQISLNDCLACRYAYSTSHNLVDLNSHQPSTCIKRVYNLCRICTHHPPISHRSTQLSGREQVLSKVENSSRIYCTPIPCLACCYLIFLHLTNEIYALSDSKAPSTFPYFHAWLRSCLRYNVCTAPCT